MFVPAGQYNFPFSFLLQPSIPSTFNFESYRHGDCHAKVNYVITANIGSVSGIKGLPPITCTQNFVVNQELILSSGSTKKQLTQEIVSCCCLNKGKSTIVSYFEKNDYLPGEKAYMITEVDNSECKADVLQIKGIFRQILEVTAQGYSETFKYDHQTVVLAGIQKGLILLGQDAKRIQVPLLTTAGAAVHPTCRGKLINNDYYLINELKLDACLCCDKNPHCILSLNVRNPDMNYAKWAEMPSNWNPQLMSAYNIQFTADFSNPIIQHQSGTETYNTLDIMGPEAMPMMTPPQPGYHPMAPTMPPPPHAYNPAFEQQTNPGMPPTSEPQFNPGLPPGFGGDSPATHPVNAGMPGMPPSSFRPERR